MNKMRDLAFICLILILFSLLANGQPKKSASDWQKMGYDHYLKGDYQEAYEAYSKCLDEKPNYEICLKGRGLSLMKLGDFGGGLFDQEDYYEAIQDFTKILEGNSLDKAEVFHNRGISYLRIREFENAVADFDSALKINPKDAETFNLRSLTRTNLLEYDLALQDINSALRLKPTDEMYILNKALILMSAKKYDESVEILDDLIKRNPTKAEYWANRGNAFTLNSKFAEAIPDLTKAIELQPNNTNFLNARSYAYCQWGKKELAKKDEDKITQLGGKIYQKCQ